MWAEDPTGPEDKERSTNLLDVALACEFGRSVNVDWMRGVVFNPRPGFCAVENIIGGVVNKDGIVLLRFFGEDSWRFSIDAHGNIGFGLGAVHRRISCGVQDHFRPG